MCFWGYLRNLVLNDPISEQFYFIKGERSVQKVFQRLDALVTRESACSPEHGHYMFE